MTSTSSKALLALALSTMLAGPALAQQQDGSNQMGQQQFRQANQQMGQQARVPEQYRREQGRVVQVRPVRVRGINTPNYLVVIETDRGRRIVADIGQDRRAQTLRQGTPIAVRGQVVRVGNRGALLLADALRVNNQTYDINRPAFRRTGISNMGMRNQQLGQGSGSSRFQQRAAIRRQLRQVGFQNIRILDAAYMVQAQTPDGRSILMMVDPPRAALLAVGGMSGQQNQSSGTGQGSQQGGSGNQGGSGSQGGSGGSGG